jgi:hypothetical protein
MGEEVDPDRLYEIKAELDASGISIYRTKSVSFQGFSLRPSAVKAPVITRR